MQLETHAQWEMCLTLFVVLDVTGFYILCILMAAIFKYPIGPPLVSAIVIYISELGSLVPKTPEKWSCLLFYDYLLARNVKMCFLMAAILNRPIWRPH